MIFFEGLMKGMFFFYFLIFVEGFDVEWVGFSYLEGEGVDWVGRVVVVKDVSVVDVCLV